MFFLSKRFNLGGDIWCVGNQIAIGLYILSWKTLNEVKDEENKQVEDKSI